jgi:nitroreductase
MEFTQVLSLRKSVRDYSTKPVEPEKITKILESAILSPS